MQIGMIGVGRIWANLMQSWMGGSHFGKVSGQ